LTDHLSVGALTRVVPRFVVDEVLMETGRREKRSRLLPAHVVVYFVLALAVFQDGYDEVIRALVHGLRFARTWSVRWSVPTTGALTRARARLGEEPLRLLLGRVARPVAGPSTPGAWLAGRRAIAIDGVMLDAPDTAANTVEYPKAVGGTRRPFLQVRLVGLTECGTHAVIDASTGSISTGERALARSLVGSVEHDMLVTADRGFYSFDLWGTYLGTGADLLWPMAAQTHLPVLAVLPDGSYLAEARRRPTGATRIEHANDPVHATHVPVRVIDHRVDTGDGLTNLEEFRLLTNVLDPEDIDAPTLARAYAQRWETESAFREIECQLLAPGATLRSKTPEMVRQEIWGILLAHYAVRSFMTEAADTVDIDPDRLSTIRAINIIRRSITDPAAFSHPEEPPARPRRGRAPRTPQPTPPKTFLPKSQQTR
jgi:hypothetical protein